MPTKADKTLTYLNLNPVAKRQAKMGAARLGVSLSQYIEQLVVADAKRTGLADLADDHEEGTDGRA